jgi:hypothetical protein
MLIGDGKTREVSYAIVQQATAVYLDRSAKIAKLTRNGSLLNFGSVFELRSVSASIDRSDKDTVDSFTHCNTLAV